MPIPDGVSWQEGIYGCPGAIGERLRPRRSVHFAPSAQDDQVLAAFVEDHVPTGDAHVYCAPGSLQLKPGFQHLVCPEMHTLCDGRDLILWRHPGAQPFTCIVAQGMHGRKEP